MTGEVPRAEVISSSDNDPRKTLIDSASLELITRIASEVREEGGKNAEDLIVNALGDGWIQLSDLPLILQHLQREDRAKPQQLGDRSFANSFTSFLRQFFLDPFFGETLKRIVDISGIQKEIRDELSKQYPVKTDSRYLEGRNPYRKHPPHHLAYDGNGHINPLPASDANRKRNR